jgi:SOS response regulatory protein OraA/RecX
VAREQTEQGLREALRERPEREVLAAVAARLLRQHAREEPRRRLLKIFTALLRRGFPVSLVRERLAAQEPGCRDMLEGYGVDAFDIDPDGRDPD